MEEKANVRILPMPAPHPIYGPEGGFPEKLKVGFRNGKVRTYRLDEDFVQQPKPQVLSSDELNRLFRENTYGGYKPKHAKK